MKQFTNKLDFSLTLKRFKMMATPASIRRSIAIAIGVLPIFVAIIFPFRDSHINPEATYADVELFPKSLLAEGDSLLSLAQIPALFFTENGIRFTGTQTEYFRKSGLAKYSNTYDQGVHTQLIIYDPEGNILSRVDKTIDFENFSLASQKYFENEILVNEMIFLFPLHSGNYLYRQWHPNGQLHTEMTNYNSPERSELINYDLEGKIIFHEHYENGELVEKIK